MAMAVSAAMSAYADDNCTIRMNIVPIDGGEEVGASVASRLEAKLMPVLSEADIAIDHSYTKLFVAGRFDNTYSEVLSGTTPRILVKTTLTLYFGNLQEQHVYSSRSFDLKGSGVSMEAAYTKCLGALSQRQAEVRNFLAEGRDKAISYFDNNIILRQQLYNIPGHGKAGHACPQLRGGTILRDLNPGMFERMARGKRPDRRDIH